MASNQDKEQEPSSELRDAIISKLQEGEKESRATNVPKQAGASSSSSAVMKKILTQNITLFGPNINDMATFCRQLAVLIDVGIPLLRSLKILSERTSHPKLQKVVAKVADHVEQGGTFSSALGKHPKIFSPLFVNVVQIGELGGILENSLKRLADIMEKKAEIKKKVLSAIMYPIVALCVAIGLVLVVLIYAIPVFAEVYEGQNVELPMATKIIIAFSDFLTNWYLLYLPLLVIMGVVTVLFIKTPAGKRIVDSLKLSFPAIGIISKKIAMARFTRTLGSLMSAGIPLLEGLSVTAETSENVIISENLLAAYDSVEKGGKMEEALRNASAFPPLVVDMIAIGDEAGALDTILMKIADTYDSDVDVALKGIMSIIEPLLIVFLGFMVMFIALALLLPYFNLVSVI